MKKILNIVYIVLFLAVICLLVGTMNTDKGVESEIDNRMLTEFPEIGDPDYFGTLEQYIKDRIGFRKEMLSVYSKMNEAVVEELDHPSYCNGQEGYVFFKMHKNVKYGEFHKTFAEMVKKLQTYCNERGTKFYLIFDPEKISVYRRYLPKGFYYNDDWVDQFCEYLDELGVTYVNNSKMLIERSYKEQVYNWKYDAGHWNDLGCFYATAELYELIRKDFPQVPQLTKDMFDITTTIAEKLYNSEIVINEEVPSFTLKTGFTNLSGEWSNEITVNQSYAHFHYYKNNAEGAENLPKTLIFQGSYYNRNPNYLIACANESIGIHNYQNIINFDYYYNIFQPDMVIFDVAEYVFSDTYFNSANMKNMDLNPSIWDGQGSLPDRIEALKAGAADGGIANVSVVPGRSIENIEVIGDFTGAKYAYIISNGQIADLSPSDEMLDAVVASGFVSGDTYIYV
ncbi:MAG: hypothetical protein KBT31_02580, partial [Firmicutes bacterium]|nr:hypothetical protein [Candidatus Colimorpha enterica]